MSGVKRWDHAVRWEGMRIAASYMAIKSGGKYVLASDYDACASRLHEVAEVCAIAEQERDALRAQVEAMRKDADRYRWLRDEATPSWGCLVGDKDESAEQKDAEIDEAMRAKP